MSNILYTYGDGLYINLTNQCPCRCVFCVRSLQNSVGSADSLWLQRDPTAQEVIDELRREDLSQYSEITFCGYGEPLCALDALLEVCRYLRDVCDLPIRLNTNGLGDLIHKKPVAPMLEGLVDTVCISLNAADDVSYQALCNPVFGAGSFPAILDFAEVCRKYVPEVKMSVVDVIDADEIGRCQQIAEELQVPLRVRHYSA